MKYTTINVQGNLISEEILNKAEAGEASGQRPNDFGFANAAELRSEIEYAWSRIKLDWAHFSTKIQALPTTDPYGTTLSRRWMEQFLSALGFTLARHRAGITGSNNQSYVISHYADNVSKLPIHVVGFLEPERPDKNTLDIKTSGGTSRLSPHATVQEYLNVSDHLYGIAANGLFLRLIRDSGRLIKLTYVEFDLRRMMEDDKYSEFALLYRLLHESRFPRTKADAEQCFLEKYYLESIASGNRIRDGLSNAVKESLIALGAGFLQHPDNTALREKIESGRLTPKDYYRQLLRIIYRLLFLMVTEERDLIYDPSNKTEEAQRLKNIYLKYYSINRLRKLSENRFVYEPQFTNLWQSLVATFSLFQAYGNGKKLGIDPLDGELFGTDAIRDLNECKVNNKLLLECIRNLNEFTDDDKNLVSINYRSLDVEELGSVYEGLLELHPVIEDIQTANPTNIIFTFHEGTERKTTGSYYTRPELVNELIKSALIPVIESRLSQAKGKVEQSKVLLKLKVCDAAAGSGHMLLAAARTIAWYLARVESGEENPAPSVYRSCLRDVIQHCIYAVDYNPDAVELCKLALWLEGHNSGKPISFLDHKIRNGNSLVGITDLSVLGNGIPNEAFDAATGDDPKVTREVKRINASFLKKRQTDLFSAQGQQIKRDSELLKNTFAEMESIEQDTIEAVHEVRKRFERVRKSVHHEEQACHIWTSAFFKTYLEVDDPTNPTSEKLAQYFLAPTQYGRLVGEANRLAEKHKFFHWPLEFPDVFEQGGFDVMLGNPPWERIKLQQQEFFATRDTTIANAPNSAARNRMINGLAQSNPELYSEYIDAVHGADSTGKFLRESGRCKLTAVGDINTYSIFAELNSSLINKKGRSGIIIPTGIATDDSNKAFFGGMVEQNRVVSLFDFENREAIFRDVHRSYKFCLLTLSGADIGAAKAQFGFFLTRVEHLQDELRIFGLTKDDFLRINPNTKTCPIFRTSVDAALTTKIYERVPILINEKTGENPWGVSFMRMFDMSNDSHLFRTKAQLEGEGFQLQGNRMIRNEEVWLPLYEAKMIWHYNHRYGSYSNISSRTSVQMPTVGSEDYANPSFTVIPWYWVSSSKIIAYENRKWHIGFRRVARTNDERTFINTVIPNAAIGDSIFLMNCGRSTAENLMLQGMCSSLVFDFIARQKFAGMNANFFYVMQFPFIPPEKISRTLVHHIVPKILELVYTAWDTKPIADDLWSESNENIRATLHAQWKSNEKYRTFEEESRPEWSPAPTSSAEFPFPPFEWNNQRRELLMAELHAIYGLLYSLTREEFVYILDPVDIYGDGFPGETFRVLKEKEIRQYGEYRTKRLVLEAWDRLTEQGVI